MKKQIALLLLLAVMFCMIPGVFAADVQPAQVVLDAGFADTDVRVTARLENVADVTNGRLTLRYEPEAADLLEIRTASGMGAVSVNREVSGEVSVAWVGSHLTEEGAEVATFVFRPAGEQDFHYESDCSELYTGSKKLESKGDKVFVSWNPFTDISGHWAEEDILEGWHRGLVRGITDTTFEPDRDLSRAMFVTILHRMAGCPEARLPGGFSDVASGRYYEDAVNWAVEQKITNGTGDGKFQPHRAISRQEMVTMLYRYAKSQQMDLSAQNVLDRFEDADQLDEWAVTAMNWAVSHDIIQGMTPTTLEPLSTSTRAQAITILCRWINE